jgi:DNA polymerase-1
MLVIFDANALLHRLYHALPNLTDSKKRSVNGLYGLSNILFKVLNEFKIKYGAVCYDRPEPTFRHKILKEYKAQRPKIADELVFQIKQSKDFFEAFGFKIFEKPGYEADDLIGTITEKTKNLVEKIVIITGDLDTLQLVDDEKVVVWTMKKGITEIKIYDEKEVFKKYNLLPNQIVDYKALVGDPSDNIEGIKGIGPKTAQKLIENYGNLEKIIEVAKKGLIDKKLAQKIIENEEKIFLYRELVSIQKNVEIEFSLDDILFKGPHFDRILNLFEEFEFKSLIKRIQKNFSQSKNNEIPQIISGNFDDFDKENEIFFQIKDNEIFFLKENKIINLNIQKIPPIAFLKKIFVGVDTKNLFKSILKNYIKDYFDLKVCLWLTNPDLKKIDNKKISQIVANNTFEEDILNIIFFKDAYKKISEKLKNLNLDFIWLNLEKPLLPLLAKIENYGIKVNQKKLKKAIIYFKTNKKILEKKIYLRSGTKINLNSPQQLSWLLFEKLKIKNPKIKTKTGIISTKKEILDKIKESHPILGEIIEWKECSKILNSYLKNLISSKKRINTNLDQTLSSTGRIISFKPNFQNLPKHGAERVLELIEAEEGFSLVSFDYKQIEIFLAAFLSNEEEILNFLKDGGDFHSLVAKEIFKDETKRDIAKTLNFGILYGMGPNAFSKLTGFDIEKSKEYINNFFLKFPALAKFLNETKEKAKIYGFSENIFGRKRMIPGIWSQNIKEKNEAERIAINFPIQSLAADILKIVIINLNQILNDDVKLILPWHDELIFEIKDNIKEKIIPEIKNIMENIDKLNFPVKINLKLNVKIKEGKNLWEIKS